MSAFRAGVLPGSFMLGDAAVAAWLWHAVQRYTGYDGALWPAVLGPVLAAPLLSFALGLHRFRPNGQAILFLKAVGFGFALAGLGAIAGARGWLPLSGREALWIGAASAGLAWLQRAVYFGAWARPPAQPWEMLRWLAVGAAGTFVMLPFYHSGSIGAGDAHWYAIMLADFIAQLRAGVFPVWVGQSLYAFNGAVSPLRYAPGFQYFGGLVDLLSAHALEPMAVRNASLAVVSLLGAFSAYACLRPIVGRRPWIACGLSILWILSPGVWAPVTSGDQYMTFMAIPFVPVALHGCWRVWERDDRWSRLWIAVGLAGTWLCHSPVALWMTLISAGMYLAAVFIRRSWRRELGLAALMTAVFAILGAFPFVSVLTLDNQIKAATLRGYTIQMVRASFPANFLPIDPNGPALANYQLGYALLGILAVALLLLFRARPRGAWAFVIPAFLILPFFVPVPWLTSALWSHVPHWFANIQNVWPMQRLFLVWASLVVFLAAIVLGSPRAEGRALQRGALIAAFVCGLIWSGHEARKVIPGIGRDTQAQTRISFGPDNIQLTRYAYSSFAYAPGYFSHSYMEPWLENRLLDRHSLDPVLENADAAAPMPPAGASQAADPRLVGSGLLKAEVIGQSNTYYLFPRLVLDPGRRYALRLEFLEPGIEGTLQFLHPSMFREYMLPDSGMGIARAGPSLPSFAFGSDASNSHVIPMIISASGPDSPNALFLAKKRTKDNFPFARYWLYTYERNKLPINVESWIPYRARVDASQPVYLETPRMWLKGWSARVNGHTVTAVRSRENLVMVPIEAGQSKVVLEYHPSAVLGTAFWMCAVGWLGLAATGLCQASLWSGGRRMRFGWTHRRPAAGVVQGPGGGSRGRLFRLAGTRRAQSAAAVIVGMAAILAVAEVRRRQHQAYLDGVGPVRIEFTRPFRHLGLSQPLLATGRQYAGTVVFITFLDNRHVRLSADVWGSLFTSEPIEMDYNKVQSLVVSDSALYPLDHPRVMALSATEIARLRGELRVELNGRTVIQAACYAFESKPSEILAGESHIGSNSEEKFSGEILKVERLPIPRTIPLWSDRHAHLSVRFPIGRTGDSEPILSVSQGSNSRFCYVTYLDDHRLRIAYWGPKGVPLQSTELAYDPSRSHDLDFEPGVAGEGPGNFDVTCYFDGVHVLSRNRAASGLPPVLVSGLNPSDAPGVLARFTGPRMELTTVPDVAKPGTPETLGPEHLIIMLPRQKAGRREPLLTTGRTGAGDFIYVIYEDENHVRIGHDHWGASGSTSDPIAIDYKIPHELWISLGALYPAATDEPFWRGLDAGLRQRLKSHVTVAIDGQEVLSSASAVFPSAPAEVTVAINRIGGSSCDPEFSGIVEFAERGGPMAPPSRGR